MFEEVNNQKVSWAAINKQWVARNAAAVQYWPRTHPRDHMSIFWSYARPNSLIECRWRKEHKLKNSSEVVMTDEDG